MTLYPKIYSEYLTQLAIMFVAFGVFDLIRYKWHGIKWGLNLWISLFLSLVTVYTITMHLGFLKLFLLSIVVTVIAIALYNFLHRPREQGPTEPSK